MRYSRDARDRQAVLLPVCAMQFPECARGEDTEFTDSARHVEKVGISGDEKVAAGAYGRGENGGVIGIAHRMREWRPWRRNDGRVLEEGDELRCEDVGDMEFPLQHATEFHDDLTGYGQFMPCENETQNIGAQSSRREGADEDVGVQEDVHDTSPKTSSSTR